MANNQDRAREAAVGEFCLKKHPTMLQRRAFQLGYDARDAEVERLKTALQNLVDAVDQAGKDLVDIYQMAAIHGVTYTGRQYIHELAEAKAALSGGEEKDAELAEADFYTIQREQSTNR